MWTVSAWDWTYWSELTFDADNKLSEIKIDRARILQQFLLTIGGILAFVLAGWRTWTAYLQANAALEQSRIAHYQFDLSERGQNVDRYARGAQMLESPRLALRQAGVYLLRELALSDAEQSQAIVVQLLSGFIRDVSAEIYHQRKLQDGQPFTTLGEDALDAFKAISRIKKTIKLAHGSYLDLSKSIIPGTTLVGLDLHRADFENADLRETVLNSVDCGSGRFNGTNFVSGRSYNSDISDAYFYKADLSEVNFNACNLTKAVFSSCTFTKTKFGTSNISNARVANIAGNIGDAFSKAWAWADRPPKLPVEISFENYFDPGTNEENRKEYERAKASESTDRFSPPNAEWRVPAPRAV